MALAAADEDAGEQRCANPEFRIGTPSGESNRSIGRRGWEHPFTGQDLIASPSGPDACVPAPRRVRVVFGWSGCVGRFEGKVANLRGPHQSARLSDPILGSTATGPPPRQGSCLCARYAPPSDLRATLRGILRANVGVETDQARLAPADPGHDLRRLHDRRGSHPPIAINPQRRPHSSIMVIVPLRPTCAAFVGRTRPELPSQPAQARRGSGSAGRSGGCRS
jgi:hypothetical protein